MNIEDYFNCSFCSGDLKRFKSGYRCSDCSREFNNQDGIACNLAGHINNGNSYVPNPKGLYIKALEMGWKNAVTEHARDYYNERNYQEVVNKQIINESIGDFQYLLPINNQSIVLIVGVCWGNITTSTARRSKFVFALDVNLDILQFVQMRSKEEELENIKYIQCATSSLPTKEHRFDAIILAGTADRMIFERNGYSSKQILSESLSTIYKALKPNGIVYIAAENRYNFSFFLGKRESHTKLRFVSLLPYHGARYYSRLFNGSEYRRANYSKLELRKLLIENGFVENTFNYPIPSYRNLRYITKLENKEVFRYLIKMLRSFPRFSHIYSLAGFVLNFMPLSLVKFFWPNFCIVAKRP